MTVLDEHDLGTPPPDRSSRTGAPATVSVTIDGLQSCTDTTQCPQGKTCFSAPARRHADFRWYITISGDSTSGERAVEGWKVYGDGRVVLGYSRSTSTMEAIFGIDPITNEPLLNQADGNYVPIEGAPWKILFHEGDEPAYFYILVKGSVRISRIIPGMGEEALAILGPGSYFGEMEIFEPIPRAAQAMAHEQACDLLAIRIADLHQAMHEDRELTISLLWNFVLTLSERLRNTNDKVMATFALAKFAGG